MWCRSTVFDSKDGGEVAESVIRVFEVERQAEDNIQRRLGVAMAARVEVPRAAPYTAARIGSSRRNAFSNESTLYPRSHDLGVDSGGIIDDEMRAADHVLEVVAGRFQAKVSKHSCNVYNTFSSAKVITHQL